MHGDRFCDETTGSFIVPIYQTAVFTHPEGGRIRARGREIKYSREDNPTVHAVERKIASLEEGEDCVALSSGMAACASILIGLLQTGNEVVVPKDMYGLTYTLVQDLTKFGVKPVFTNPGTDNVAEQIHRRTKLVYVEAMSNPLLIIYDIERLAEAASRFGACLVVDNTFTTPFNLRPLSKGAELVVHSATKYLGGHNDVTAGAVIGPAETLEIVWEWRRRLGCILDPNTAFLLDRGLKTLGLRVARHNESALTVAKFLEQHKGVKRVHYPGLDSHPSHDLAKRLLRGFGGVVSFELKGTSDLAVKVMRKLSVVKRAPSLGGTESLITHPASTSHKDIPARERVRLGITDALLRVSVGLEDVEDLIGDLDQALSSR